MSLLTDTFITDTQINVSVFEYPYKIQRTKNGDTEHTMLIIYPEMEIRK